MPVQQTDNGLEAYSGCKAESGPRYTASAIRELMIMSNMDFMSSDDYNIMMVEDIKPGIDTKS